MIDDTKTDGVNTLTKFATVALAALGFWLVIVWVFILMLQGLAGVMGYTPDESREAIAFITVFCGAGFGIAIIAASVAHFTDN